VDLGNALLMQNNFAQSLIHYRASEKYADDELRLIGVLLDRKKERIKAFLETIPERLRTPIAAVCIDMRESYSALAREIRDCWFVRFP